MVSAENHNGTAWRTSSMFAKAILIPAYNPLSSRCLMNVSFPSNRTSRPREGRNLGRLHMIAKAAAINEVRAGAIPGNASNDCGSVCNAALAPLYRPLYMIVGEPAPLRIDSANLPEKESFDR